jgi:hypothetical protein
MIGRDDATAKVLASSFRAVAGLDALPPNQRKLFDDILESALDPRVPGAILPAPLGRGCRIYVVATDQKEWRRLAPLLSAFAGPTLTSFTGVIHPPSGEDPLDAFARVLPAEVIAVAEAHDTSVDAMRALRRMIALLRRAPQGASQTPRSTSWLLSDFEDALNVGDRLAAERLIERLRDECRLDALNLRFLTVQLLASLGSWAELRALSYFADLCLARKPGTIAAHLGEALFHTDLAAAFATADVENCRSAYARIRSLAAPLVLLPPPAALGPGGWRLYSLAALAAEHPETRLLSAIANGPDVGWVGAHLQVPPGESPVDVAPEPEADYVQIRRALERLAELPLAQRARLLAIEPLRSLFASGSDVEPAFVPLSWRDWLNRISDSDYTKAFEVARKGALEWRVEDAADPAAAAELAEALADALGDEVSRSRLAQALPLFVNWLQRDSAFPRPSMRPVYETVLTLFALGEARDRGIMASAAIVGEALLSIGNSTSDYKRLLHSLATLFSEGTGTGSIYLLLEFIEATLRHPCPDQSARETFWLTALAVLEPLRLRLEPAQLATLAALGELLGWSEPPFAKTATTAPDQLARKLANLRIGIYTLTESAARQAASVLTRVAPSAIVQTSSHHVGSAQLKVLAQNSDLLVITSLSATHAATEFIRAHRPVGKPICWAAGRGFTSIVRAIENFLGGTESTISVHAE